MWHEGTHEKFPVSPKCTFKSQNQGPTAHLDRGVPGEPVNECQALAMFGIGRRRHFPWTQRWLQTLSVTLFYPPHDKNSILWRHDAADESRFCRVGVDASTEGRGAPSGFSIIPGRELVCYESRTTKLGCNRPHPGA